MEGNIQTNTWDSDFGKDYTERNALCPEKLDNLYEELFGHKRTSMNKVFLDDLSLLNERILEVGCNTGDQLRLLQKMGYMNLYGIELQRFAVEKSKTLTENINIIQGFGNNLPFKDGYFSLVFTSGVLIHIAPENVGSVMDEIYRCSGRYIWGFEYFADKYTEIPYRGNRNLMWKANFARIYMERFKDLKLVMERKYTYIGNNNTDSMFLLEKR